MNIKFIFPPSINIQNKYTFKNDQNLFLVVFITLGFNIVQQGLHCIDTLHTEIAQET